MEQIEFLKMLCSESWSNEACLGYALIACNNLGYTQEQTAALLNEIEGAFTNYSTERAMEKYKAYSCALISSS